MNLLMPQSSKYPWQQFNFSTIQGIAV